MVEVIVVRARDFEQINKFPIDRVEFCRGMKYGGLTPDFCEVEKAAKISKVDIHVMIRNNYDTFTYSDDDIALMVSQIKKFDKLNIKGYVIGCNDGTQINLEQLKTLRAATNKELTYHRAFDLLTDKKQRISELAPYINTILTSGDHAKAFDSIEQLESLCNDEITILAASGINLDNAYELYKRIGAIHLGSSLRTDQDFNNPLSEEALKKLFEIITWIF